METPEQEFGGSSFEPKRDGAALKAQLDTVRSIMLGGGWLTLAEIATRARDRSGKIATEASVSARLRDLRKANHGSYNIEKRIREGSARLWEYHLGTGATPVADFAHGKTRSESAGC